ncbi:hypothetical protein [Curtobacterium flaccumfaciens]|uniref:hypothetical protein n=1 Tax=Curtobacterium flaccumfaciens TaxID=2035 RepID=UPI00399164C0
MRRRTQLRSSRARPESALGTQLLLAEYETVRDESRQAREAQQATLNWSLAGLAALFGGGLVYATATLKSDHPHPVNAAIFFLIFGVVIPGFAIASIITYVGEISRMERAGRYLRGFEIALVRERVAGRAPLLWERFLANGDAEHTRNDVEHTRDSELKIRKSAVPYVGGFMLYCGGMIASWLICAMPWADGSYANALRSAQVASPSDWVLPLVAMLAVATGIAVAIGWVGLQALAIHRLVKVNIDIPAVDRLLVAAAAEGPTRSH